MYLLEERKAAVEDRLKLTNNKLDSTNTCLETVDGRRIDMVSSFMEDILNLLIFLLNVGDKI